MMETQSENYRTRKSSFPFYAPPSCVIKTSAEIISEARAAMASKTITSVHSPQSIRTVNTKRPFTPRDTNRILFGSKKSSGRPPSAINIHQVQFHELDVASLPKITEVPKIDQNTLPSTTLLKLKPQRWRLPAISDSRSQRKQLHRSSLPLENLPEELPEIKYQKKIGAEKKSKETMKTEMSIEEEKEDSPPPTEIQEINSTSSTDPAYDNEPWSPKDYKTKGFPHGLCSPRKVVDMDKLMEGTEVMTDIAIEENRINEARAADVIEPVKIDEEVIEEAITVESSIMKLNEMAGNDWNEADVIELLDKLCAALEKEGVTTSKNNKIKSQVLKTIFKYVETSSEPLLLHLARIILVLRVNGQNLSAVCKLIFKVARSDKNDKYFLEKNILEHFIESLGRASPLEDAEACIYGYGALKFLTMNNTLLRAILKLGTLQLMVLHLKIVNNARLEFVPIPEQTSHALFQLTGALRNIASEDGIFTMFACGGAVFELCRSMQLFSADLDLISNIARTLSIISTNDECCHCVVNYEGCFSTFTKLLHKFPGRQDIVVRLGYALGNIMAKSNAARIKLYEEPGALKAILDLLDNYLEKDLEMQIGDPEVTHTSPHLGSDGSVEDVIIKMIRIIANMCMHPEVGIALVCGNDDENESSYVFEHNKRESGHFLDILLKILRRKSLAESEELVLSTLSTFNNLSFYSNPENYTSLYDGPFVARQIEIAEALNSLLMCDNDECLIEVTRVLGNLTRCKQIRDFLLETGGLCLLVRFLEKDNEDLLTTTTGVLVNMMSDWDKRIALKEDNGIARLIWILGKYGESNWKLANLICQSLWNFCIDSTHLYAALGVQPTNQLLSVLVELLDEERLFGIVEGEGEIDQKILERQDYQMWEDFANCATNLLEKIEQYLESLNTTIQENT